MSIIGVKDQEKKQQADVTERLLAVFLAVSSGSMRKNMQDPVSEAIEVFVAASVALKDFYLVAAALGETVGDRGEERIKVIIL